MKIKTILLILLIFQTYVFSQDTTRAKIVTYEVYNTNSLDPTKDLRIFKNDIKWNISMLGRGALIINYERVILKKLSIESGISLNYRDYILEGDWQSNNYFFPPENKGIKASIGLGFEISPRLYPKDGNLDGFYISPVFRFRSYNVSVKDPMFYGNTYNGDYDVSYETTEAAFLIGSQWESYLIDGTVEYYFGVGYRKNDYKEITENSGTLDIANKSEMYPCILFGFKLGISF